MGKLIGILGSTGSGKSRSVKHLDPKTTVVINCANNKDLPFKGSRTIWNKNEKNLFFIDNYPDLINMIKGIDSKAPQIKTIILDDFRYQMSREFFSRAKETGYGKFTSLAVNFQSILELINTIRDDITVFAMLHDDDVISDNKIVAKKIKLVGKLVEDQYNPAELMSILLYAHCSVTKEGATWSFYTNKTLIDGIEIPAKSPEGLFELTMPNDLSLVLKAIEEYYN